MMRFRCGSAMMSILFTFHTVKAKSLRALLEYRHRWRSRSHVAGVAHLPPYLPGCVAVADTREAALELIQEAFTG